MHMVCVFIAAIQKTEERQHCRLISKAQHLHTIHNTIQLKNETCLKPVYLQNENVSTSLITKQINMPLPCFELS